MNNQIKNKKSYNRKEEIIVIDEKLGEYGFKGIIKNVMPNDHYEVIFPEHYEVPKEIEENTRVLTNFQIQEYSIELENKTRIRSKELRDRKFRK